MSPRDVFDFMHDHSRGRSRFGDNESIRGNDSVRSDLIVRPAQRSRFQATAVNSQRLGCQSFKLKSSARPDLFPEPNATDRGLISPT